MSCSITDAFPAPVTVPGFVGLVEHLREVAAAVTSAMSADPTLLAELPDDLLESATLDLHATVDSATAAATIATGRLDRKVGSVRGKLLAGKHASTGRFLQREAGLSPVQSKAVVARGRDLDSPSIRVADAWLAGVIPGGAVRDLTLGVTDVLRRSGRIDAEASRDQALDILLPVAATGRVDHVQEAVARLKLTIDPDGGTEDALFAFERQTLSIVDVGTMFRVSGWLPHDSGAAVLTVLDRFASEIGAEQVGDVDHEPGCEQLHLPGAGCSCGALDRAMRRAGLHHDQLRARALGEVAADLLSGGQLGSHHGVPPQVTVVADITDVAAPLMGRLTVPGSDHDALLPEETVHRLLCDADVSHVLTTTAAAAAAAANDADGGDAAARERGFLRAVVATLDGMARSVLYVGRARRTVSARLRTALQVRDGHCVFPGCRARARRCHAHHVVPWEHGGPTDLPNLALLCVAHHHAVHEGGWSIRLKPGCTGHERDCWESTPPLLRRRSRRP